MPQLDGYEATKKIRFLEGNKKNKIPIIAMTANAFIEDVEKSYQAGMDYHITKPINEFVLLCILEECLCGSRNQYALADAPISNSNKWPDELPGFMVKEALNRYKDKRKNFQKTLLQFIEIDYIGKLSSMIEQRHYDEAQRLSHSLCGVAGLLGLIKVSEASRYLNKILRNNTSDLTLAFNKLNKEYIIVMPYIYQITKLIP